MKTRIHKSRRRNRDHARMRRALLGPEALEARQLMAGDLVSLAPDSLLAIQDQTSQILDVLGNDRFDPAYSGARQISAVSAGDRGGEFSISADGRRVLYTPPPGYSSREHQVSPPADSPLLDSLFADFENFTYVVDGAFEQAARVFVRPVVSRDSYDFDVNDQNRVLNVLSNDAFFPGYAGLKKITAVSAATQDGTVSIAANGKSLVYSPAVDFVGTEEFSYVVDDTYEAHVLVNLRTAVRSDYYGDYNGSFVRNDGTHVLNVLANDCYQSHQSSWDSSCTQIDVNRITSVEQPTSGGTVSIAADGRSLNYRSADNFSGHEVFSYVADGKYRASVTVHVRTPDDSAQFFQNESERTIRVLANDLFRDGYSGPRVITSVSAANGSVSIAADGKSLSYKPKPDTTRFLIRSMAHSPPM
jgi:Bacterial Ig domain